MSLFAVIPAGGVGERAQANGPKQYQKIHHQTLLEHTVQALLSDDRVQSIHIGVAPNDAYISSLNFPANVFVHRTGGASRAQTVLQTIHEVRHQSLDPQAWVLVHDAARPALPTFCLTHLINACLENDRGGILALPVADTVKLAQTETASDTPITIEKTIPRQGLWLAQTPQLFKAQTLEKALTQALAQGVDITDEASAMEWMGEHPLLIRGDVHNIKVTWPQDFQLMEQYLCNVPSA